MVDYNELSEEEQIKLVKENGYFIQYIDNPSEAVQLAAVKKNGWGIEFIENPSEAVQLAAVQSDGRTIQYFENPNEAIQLAAVHQHQFAIRFIKKPTKNVIQYCLYECEISKINVLESLYENLTSDEDRIYFKMKYGGIIND